MRLAAPILLCALVVACAPTLPRPYLESRAQALREYAAGRYDGAAESWLAAARSAERKKDRNEALYRAGAAYRRAGRYGDADRVFSQLLEASPRASRAARAAYDRAVDAIEHGDAEQGWHLLDRALADYPDAGTAGPAVDRILRKAEDDGGVKAARAALDRLIKRLDDHEISEHLHFRYAGLLEADGQLAAARDRYVYCADRFPYPLGRFWDDALWKAADLEDRLNRPAEAIALLERMLREREPSSLNGTYHRPRMAAAQMRVGELYRDRLHDGAAARRAFRRVATDFSVSVFVDDALWSEARLARAAGDERSACQALDLLVDVRKDSRYVACAPRLCSSAKARGECRDYISRELDP